MSEIEAQNQPHPSTSPRVAILLLNYKGLQDTLDCLTSLNSLKYPNVEVIVIDNASGDGSADTLREEASRQGFHFIESDANLGFSGGNNLGIRHALDSGVDYIWLLNNDCTVLSDTLTHLVIEAEKTGGLTGSVLYYPDETYQRVGTTVNWWTGSTRGIPEKRLRDGMAVDNLCGASLLIPASVLQRVGLMEESYFLYFEDGEYTLRAQKAGFSATLARQSKVLHKEGASTGSKSPQTQYYYHRNRLKMLFQYANRLQKLCISGYLGFRLFRSMWKAQFSANPDHQTGFRIQWLAITDFMKGISGKCPHGL